MIEFSTIHFEELDSTNTKCMSLARNGAAHGTVVIADHQSAGKGRRGRYFCSPKGAGLYCSVLIREGFNMENINLITPCAAVAAAKAIEELSGHETKIKWVNDIFMGGRKLCGILTEASLPDFAVIGIGINLLYVKDEFTEELHSIATSIEEQTGKVIKPIEMEKSLLFHLSNELSKLSSKAFLNEYKKRSFVIGKEIEVHSGNKIYNAKAIDIDDNAGLILELPDKTKQTLITGEVSVRIK